MEVRASDTVLLRVTYRGKSKRYSSVERYIFRLRREDLCQYKYFGRYCSNKESAKAFSLLSLSYYLFLPYFT
jgi:hypothetical protein